MTDDCSLNFNHVGRSLAIGTSVVDSRRPARLVMQLWVMEHPASARTLHWWLSGSHEIGGPAMWIRNARLAAAVVGVSVSAFAFAQSAQPGTGSGGSPANPSAPGSATGQPGGPTGAQPGTGAGTGTGSGTGVGTGAGTGAGSVTEPGNDGMGNTANDQSRQMQRGQMGGGDAENKMNQQLDKIASMPDRAPDALFVLGVAGSNLWEVEFSRLAQTKAQDDKVKELARMIEQDHSQANQRLQPIAQKMGLELPQSLPAMKQKKLAIYQAMSAEDFETCYLLENKAGHAKSIVSFADHQKSVKDESLRQYVSETLPKLVQHGSQVRELASEKGFTGGMMPGGSGGMQGGDGSMQGGTGAMPGGTRTTPGAGSSTPGAGSNTPGTGPQTPDPRNPGNQQNPSDR